MSPFGKGAWPFVLVVSFGDSIKNARGNGQGLPAILTISDSSHIADPSWLILASSFSLACLSTSASLCARFSSSVAFSDRLEGRASDASLLANDQPPAWTILEVIVHKASRPT
jgi:hypothetical protein